MKKLDLYIQILSEKYVNLPEWLDEGSQKNILL